MKNTFITKSLLLIVLTSIQLLGYAQTDSTAHTVFCTHYQVMPQFPGGDEAMQKFIKERVYLPQDAKNKGIEGRVSIRFVVSKEGELKDIAVIRGIHPKCDSIAVDIVKQMPKWIPGKEYGKPVNNYFTLPVFFKLSSEPNIVDGRKVYRKPDMPANFPLGYKIMLEYISEHLPLPKPITNNDQRIPEITISVQLEVSEEGRSSNIFALPNSRPDLSEIAVDVIKSIPRWISAKP